MELSFEEMLFVGLRRQGITFDEIGSLIGVTKATISLYTTEQSVPRNIDIVKTMAKAINFSDNDTQEFLKLYEKRRSKYAKTKPCKSLREQIAVQGKYIQELEDRIAELEGKK